MTPDPSLYTVIIAIVTAFSSTAAWNFWTRKLALRASEAKEEEKQRHLYRDDLRERVAILESKLEESHKERDVLMEKIVKLSETIAAMKVEIEFLRKENDTLKRQLKANRE